MTREDQRMSRDNYFFVAKSIEIVKNDFQLLCCERMVELFKEKYPPETSDIYKWLREHLNNKREELSKKHEHQTS